MKLIVGLGNPGKEYENTRHNIGFIFLDYYSKFKGFSIDKEKFNGLYSDFLVNGEKFIFLKPQKYMNLSGEVVKKYMDFFKIHVEDIFIVHDDLDLPFGKIRLRMAGSSGGHNGLKNIELNIGSSDFKRMKYGISNNKNIDTKDYVLGKFDNDSLNTINLACDKFVNIIDDFNKLSFEELMSKYNGR